MPAFPKPKFVYQFDLQEQIGLLESHKKKRLIPNKSDEELLIASWNIANLGLQKRWQQHAQLISEIISWFDIIAIQEVNYNLQGLRQLESELPSHYDLIFSDKAGNNERFAFAYDSRKTKLMELVGEVAVPPKDHRYIKLPNVQKKFNGFDRNPYLTSFQWRNTNLVLINVHSFFGSNSKADMERRALETYAISRYADLNGKSKWAFSKNIIALGDFNLPIVEKGDLIYQALMKRGLELPKHSSKVYSNITNDKMYDQISFLPSIKKKIKANGIFDFDNSLFPDLWIESKSKFKSYMKYYISDHRPIWMQLKF
ncbi:endonuclease/exonuclease/phosphatase family protein [Flavivirga jejuensis]|uniref:Endonuclease/exonuclease/phosphatase family protein n=1 Tax=Flavivirga jejuensis TaxID=870487 RepID=A0ABT8WSV9_9FLAO|nr:endonuclease/exonuclease/phosphatase family protein [Flavivirga jejuensis]MDO5976253.1 endonuclease/exonuclease/phosphatase family protein [Flavivirga jejuensis]MDO5976255.1 endonuclease/exonuclease/phosphatase family protein [Flavivirga jejuensis]